jgi:hypothetical protein
MASCLVFGPKRPLSYGVALALALAAGAAGAAPPPPAGGGAPTPGSSWAVPQGSGSAGGQAGAGGAGGQAPGGAPAGARGPGEAAGGKPTGEAGAGGKPAGEAAKAPAADEAPVVVVVRSEGQGLDAASVRAEIARELGVPAVAPEAAPGRTRGTLTVTWRAAPRELVVGFQHPERGALTRVVDAPERPAEVAHAAALLAGNLARDDEGEVARPTGQAAPAKAPPTKHLAAHFSLFHPIATNRDAPEATVNVSLNVIYGRVGGLDGVQLGPINVVAGDAKGAQFALGWNWSRGTTSGFQGALMGFNYAGGKADAWQFAPVFNYAGGALSGVQASLGANVAGGEVRGAQLAGVNVAGDVRGLQAGLVNVGGRVKGVQLGLINVADDVEGAPIGLISVTKTGGVHPVVWASSTTFGNAGVKFATRYTYTMASAAYHRDDGREFVGGGATLGAQIPFDRTRFSFDLQYLFLYDPGPCSSAGPVPCGGDDFVRQRHLGKARLSAGYRLQPHLGFFLGFGATLEVRRKLEWALEQGGVREDETRARVRPEFFGGLEF